MGTRSPSILGTPVSHERFYDQCIYCPRQCTRHDPLRFVAASKRGLDSFTIKNFLDTTAPDFRAPYPVGLYPNLAFKIQLDE